MNWEAIGAAGEVIGAVAVILSLIYLAIQIRGSAKIAQAQSQRELLDLYGFFGPTAVDASLVSIIRRGMGDFESLSEDEKVQFHSWLHPLMTQVEACFRMHRKGLIEEDSFFGYRDGAAAIISTPGGSAWWALAAKVFPVEFTSEIDQRLQSNEVSSWTDYFPYFGVLENDA